MADPLFVPVDNKALDWPRKVANAANNARLAIKGLIERMTAAEDRSHPFDELSADPPSPTEGRTYYNTTTHKVRTYDGTAWQNHW